MKTSKILRKAADEIRRRGWHQGAYGSNFDERETCAVCSIGALHAAETGNPWAWGDPLFVRAVCSLTEVVGLPIDIWNDAEGRTVEEVLDVFERAASAAEIEELAADVQGKLDALEVEDIDPVTELSAQARYHLGMSPVIGCTPNNDY